MKLADIKRYCSRYGVQIEVKQDEKDRRKRYYRMYIPVYRDGQTEPIRMREYLVVKPSDCVRYMDTLLADEEFRAASVRWVQKQEDKT